MTNNYCILEKELFVIIFPFNYSIAVWLKAKTAQQSRHLTSKV
jgi:hypothetical protein